MDEIQKKVKDILDRDVAISDIWKQVYNKLTL